MRRHLLISAASASILTVGANCSPAARDRLMRFFFEIPESPASQQASPGSSSAATAPATAPEGTESESLGMPVRRQWVTRSSFASTHPPFVQRQCRACHDAEHPSVQRADSKTVCGACHTAVFVPRPFMHGPFASGACTKCHQPHVSTLPSLLRESDPRLCLGCHDMTQRPKCSGQLAGVASRCTPCHEPHAADQKYMLKPRDQWEHLLAEPASDVHGDRRR